jgi:hypothetical protein
MRLEKKNLLTHQFANANISPIFYPIRLKKDAVVSIQDWHEFISKEMLIVYLTRISQVKGFRPTQLLQRNAS